MKLRYAARMVEISLGLVLLASAAQAQGLNLGWKGATAAAACPTNIGAYVDFADPCDGTRTATLVGTVVAPTGLTKVVSEELSVRFEFAAPRVPDFWSLEPGGCRDGSLVVSAVFAGFATGTATAQCSNYWGNDASGSFTWQSNTPGPSWVSLHATFARPPTTATAMIAGRQYYVFQATFDGAAGGSCPGCEIEACVNFCWLGLRQANGLGDTWIRQPAVRNWVTWQGQDWTGAIYCPPLHDSGCDDPTRGARKTWGEVKSLYR